MKKWRNGTKNPIFSLGSNFGKKLFNQGSSCSIVKTKISEVQKYFKFFAEKNKTFNLYSDFH